MIRVFVASMVVFLASCPTAFGAQCGDGCPPAYVCSDGACVPVTGEGEGDVGEGEGDVGEGEGDAGEGEGDAGEGEGDAGEGEGDAGEGEGDTGEGEGEGMFTVRLGGRDILSICETGITLTVTADATPTLVASCGDRTGLPWPANRCAEEEMAVVVKLGTEGTVIMPFCTSNDAVSGGGLWQQCDAQPCSAGLACESFGGAKFTNRFHLPQNNSNVSVCTASCDGSANGTCLAGLLRGLPPSLGIDAQPTGGMLVPDSWFGQGEQCPTDVAVVFDLDNGVGVVCDTVTAPPGVTSFAVADGTDYRVANGIPAPNVDVALCGSGSEPRGPSPSRARLCAQEPASLLDNHAACGLGNPVGPMGAQTCVSRFAFDKVEAGMSCTSNRQCGSGSCFEGRCGPLVAAGDIATNASQCLSGAVAQGRCLIAAGDTGTLFSPGECASGQFQGGGLLTCATSNEDEPCGRAADCAPTSNDVALVCDTVRLHCVFPDAPLDTQGQVDGCPGFVDPTTSECFPSSLGGACVTRNDAQNDFQGSCNAGLVCLENVCR
jgi:hypothetical protein